MHNWVKISKFDSNIQDFYCENCGLKAFTLKGSVKFWIDGKIDFLNKIDLNFDADANDINCDELIIKNIIE